MNRRLLFLVLFMPCITYAQISITWDKKSFLPSTSRIECGSFVIDSNFYLVGGGDSNSHFLNEVWRYNINDNQWENKDTLPIKIVPSNGFAINGRGYICTGIALDSFNNWKLSNEVFEYDPQLDVWIKKADFPGGSRETASSFTYDGKAYVGLGYDGVQSLTDLWEYSPDSDTWAQKASLPSVGRSSTVIVILDSFAYFIDGVNSNPYTVLNECWRYNITSNQWVQLSNMPGLGKYNVIAYSIGKYIVAGAGGINPYSFTNDFYFYNTVNDVWDTLVCLGLPNTGDGSMFTYHQTPYFFGGFKTGNPNFTYYRDLWTFDPTPILDYTSLHEIKSSSQLIVYPNPIKANSSFCISSPALGEISFFNSLGQSVFTTKINGGNNYFKVDQFSMASQVMLYRIVLQNGESVFGKITLEQ